MEDDFRNVFDYLNEECFRKVISDFLPNGIEAGNYYFGGLNNICNEFSLIYFVER